MELSGKDCLVTGASSGLGLAIAKGLARMGANTTLLCRDKVTGEEAIRDIRSEVPDASLELMICDLASLESIRQFIEEFKAKHAKLDVLLNNAAVMKRNRTVTKDGFEMMFQVNYLAPFMLMNAFVALLQNGSSPQVINNALPSYKLRLDLEDLEFTRQYSMYHSFFLTKLCLLLAGLEFARRHGRDGIDTILAVPGPFKSRLVREIPLAGWFKNLFSMPVEKAAANILYIITSDSLKPKNGKAFKKRKEWPLSDYWQDTQTRERLWSITESLLQDSWANAPS